MFLEGFSNIKGEIVRWLEANIWHESDESVDIIMVNVIQANSNIVYGSYRDGRDDHMRDETTRRSTDETIIYTRLFTPPYCQGSRL